jgi:hypothetical protein
MKFLCLYKPSRKEGTPPTQSNMEEMGKLIEDGFKTGWLVATEGCLPSALGARVRLANGNYTVTDGPFTESKELVAGFAIIQAKSKEEAIEHTRRFLKIAGDGETEIRQMLVRRVDQQKCGNRGCFDGDRAPPIGGRGRSDSSRGYLLVGKPLGFLTDLNREVP